jgi:hypothetical protein
MSDALPLPPRPNVEQYRKLAKDLLHASRSGDPGAVGDWAARWAPAGNLEVSCRKFGGMNEGAARCKLADAQRIIKGRPIRL